MFPVRINLIGVTMFESDIEMFIAGGLFVLWFANAWYLNEKLNEVHAKLDKTLDCFDGLREYLYEIDPQFDDERESLQMLNQSLDQEGGDMFAGMDDMQLTNDKERLGKRTLNTPFIARD